ncbi:alpha/beta fold hydrolase [Pedobacter sp. L105]|uniref:alpha/beta fold hydrolase n=1 Tax=Pedobacter sp. L105 TaxID=1641871 RepID=UPI00131C07B7|nr:alpha/beta fold hydrolase [Pedobacter sp. L105]
MTRKMKLCFCLLVATFSLLKASAQTAPDLSDYPLHVQFKRSSKPVLVYLTGDGGWNSFSEGLVNELGKSGYATIALDTRKYFWTGKTPDEFARDMKMILSAYLKAWNKESFSIIGYSFGADVGAFLPAHLPEQLSAKINSLVLLSPGLTTAYVVKLKNMLNFGASTANEKYKVYPELLKSAVPVWCIFGKDEESDFYGVLKETDKIHKLNVPGNHHYNDDTPAVARAVLKGL